ALRCPVDGIDPEGDPIMPIYLNPRSRLLASLTVLALSLIPATAHAQRPPRRSAGDSRVTEALDDAGRTYQLVEGAYQVSSRTRAGKQYVGFAPPPPTPTPDDQEVRGVFATALISDDPTPAATRRRLQAQAPRDRGLWQFKEVDGHQVAFFLTVVP